MFIPEGTRAHRLARGIAECLRQHGYDGDAFLEAAGIVGCYVDKRFGGNLGALEREPAPLHGSDLMWYVGYFMDRPKLLEMAPAGDEE